MALAIAIDPKIATTTAAGRTTSAPGARFRRGRSSPARTRATTAGESSSGRATRVISARRRSVGSA
jgi:hypothetical protein